MPVGDPWLVQQGGAFCITNRTQAWPGGQSEFNPPSFKEAFASEFKSAGLPIEGDPENLFDTGNSDATADFAVAGVITEFVQHYCTPNLSPSAQTNQKGSVSMTVDWEVYSRLEKQIVATVHTTGDSTLDEPKPAGLSVMTVDAFTQNVRQLAASPDLRRVLAGAPRGETELVKPDAFDKIQLSGSLAAQARPVDASVSSVLLIRAGSVEGSGALISKDGYVVTAAHVVGDAPKVKVRWSDGVETDADVVRVAKGRDVALLKTDPRGHTPLPMRRDEPDVGDPVFAIGSDLGEKFQSSVTKGVMSADRVQAGYAFIQSDVTVGPGSSGGPLFDGQGRVIGLSVLGVREAGFIPTGINFFVPTRDVIDFLSLDPR